MKHSFSYSQLAAALNCQQLYKYLYVDKLQVPELESLTLHFGTALHSGLNALLEGTDGNAAFNAYWDSLVGLEFEPGRHSFDNLRDMGHLFLDRFAKLHLKHYTYIKGETRMYAKTPRGLHLEGTADAVVNYKGKVTLVDFKTSATRYDNARIQASDQLRLYAYLAQQNGLPQIENIMYVIFIKQKEPSIQVLVQKLDQDYLRYRISNIEDQCMQIKTALATNNITQNHNACFNYGKRCKYFSLCHPEINVASDKKEE